MSITDVFELGGPATVEEVDEAMVRIAAEHGLTEEEGARFAGEGAFVSSGLWVYAVATSPLPFPDPVTEVFGFAPVVTVGFHNLKGPHDPARLQHDEIRLVVAILTALPGDAYLAFEREITRLARIGGRLTISADDEYWDPESVALLPPHDRAKLPNM